MTESKPTIAELIIEYFKQRPKEDIPHGPVVDYVEERYVRAHGRKPRDTWRQIRRLYQDGILTKVRKGVYRYDPDTATGRNIKRFPPDVKELILKRDGYRCVVCGRGIEDGVELHVDHKVPLDKGGKSAVDNGQTLCSEHNLLKKRYSQTEFGKRFLIKLYEDAVKQRDERMIKFCKEIFDVYNKHGVNDHIPRPNGAP